MFTLCRTCTEQENQTTTCHHNGEERSLSGCWVSLELIKAVDKGYVVTRIDEVWHFPQCLATLFSDDVKTFLQYKHAVSESFPRKHTYVIMMSVGHRYKRRYYVVWRLFAHWQDDSVTSQSDG